MPCVRGTLGCFDHGTNSIPHSVSLPVVSIIIPCRNEASHVERCLASILASTYPTQLLDIVVVDGMSDDGTRSIVTEFTQSSSAVRMLDNPRRITPAALNIGIAAARGDVIMRMDAHSAYPPHYISRLVAWLSETGADNVGGACVTRPANESIMARAIAVGLSHPLGVGNSHFRLGTDAVRWVDTVPYGCYQRSVFDRLGGFDEALARNQDDEFNARLRRAGGRILLVPDVTSEYVARDSLGKLWRMYYQYGLFKPLAVWKARSAPTMRQLVPAAFVLSCAVAVLAAFNRSVGLVPLATLVALYAIAIASAAVSVARAHGLRVALASIAVFAVLHISYGVGYLKGLVTLTGVSPTSRPAHAIPMTR
jgi:glycosyltransferase involved in cell wall biosynthesis